MTVKVCVRNAVLLNKIWYTLPTDEGVIYKTKDMIADNNDMMWKFSKQYQNSGIYSDFEMLRLEYAVVSSTLSSHFCSKMSSFFF